MAASTWTCWRNPAHDDVAPHPNLGWPRCRTCGAAPAYYERSAFLPTGLTLGVFAIRPGARTAIAPGSGVVALLADGDDRTLVHYEGWIHGAAQYADRDAHGRWQAGVEHAAGRLVTDYPTTAMTAVDTDDLVLLGWFDPKARLVDVHDEDALATWLDGLA